VTLTLVQLVGHLIEADNESANILHPYAILNGEKAERRVGVAAHPAGMAMLTEGQREWVTREWAEKETHLAPVHAHITEVQMVGIARLRYRPRTSATAIWLARTAEWEEMATRFDEMTREIDGPGNMQHQGNG
jgi:hypothetical protein